MHAVRHGVDAELREARDRPAERGDRVGRRPRLRLLRAPAIPTTRSGRSARRGCEFLDEPYAHGQPTLSLAKPGTDLAPTVVPPGYYFMMGDNRTSSADSRAWGPVPRSQLIGRVFVTYWPVGRLAFW